MAFVKRSDGIVINTDESHYKAILAQRAAAKKAAAVSEELDALKNELEDIKSLLGQVLNRKQDV